MNSNNKDSKKLLNKLRRKQLETGWDDTEEDNIENENWIDLMMPYSDLTTILLVFFIFFFIFNTVSPDMTAKESGSFATKTNTEKVETGKTQADENMISLDSTLAVIDKNNLEELKNSCQDTIGGIKEHIFTVSGEVLFESGSPFLKRTAESTLRLVANQIKTQIGNDPNWQIRIEGHTDNIPINTPYYKSNWELSTARAVSVVRYFLQNHHFKADQLQAMGYGEHKPIASNSTRNGRKMNRRVEIKLSYKNPNQTQNISRF